MFPGTLTSDRLRRAARFAGLPVTDGGADPLQTMLKIQNDVSSVVEELLTEAAAELVAERAGLLTAEWLDK
ncbi:hypothetical protein [Streptomyces capitiformicae]|uniref:Uncharacterized protein n=1 Tax=Streptomyces capitiformicae TaxID=2014920 RepID=A0A918YY96_9ACTN|nr:hypothetical protein [Streptomyces capitiformicae]GHE28857.1 hypothetical protein GCM10017771_44180 [Streptomyces capitiformicae]